MHNKVCFIGHRWLWGQQIKEKLKETIIEQIENGYKIFTMGTHGEFDKTALSVCRDLRDYYKDIEIEVVLTSLHLIDKKVIFEGKNKYGEIEKDVENSPYEDVKTVMYDIEDVFYKRKILVSNQLMINACDVLICYVNPKNNYSGAYYAYKYAKNKGLKIINLFNENNLKN
ncbi:MAG: hypothetical protein IJT25_01635 [Clostridia bacterium]|nr:hypothetical protein [Clostridia bacterium]